VLLKRSSVPLFPPPMVEVAVGLPSCHIDVGTPDRGQFLTKENAVGDLDPLPTASYILCRLPLCSVATKNRGLPLHHAHGCWLTIYIT